MLYHVGCGAALFTKEALASGVMAMSCRCGAIAPLVVEDLDDGGSLAAVPYSLAALRGGMEPPHLEYYLGFSDFACPAKDAWERALRVAGMVSFGECEQAKCRAEMESQRNSLVERTS